MLTPKGQTLFPVIVGLRQWAEGNLFDRGERRSRLVERQSGRPVARLEMSSADGRPVAFSDVMVVDKLSMERGSQRDTSSWLKLLWRPRPMPTKPAKTRRVRRRSELCEPHRRLAPSHDEWSSYALPSARA